MLKRFTIRQRILLTFLATVLMGSLLQLIIAGRQLQLATLEFYQHHLETDALMMAATLTESFEHYLEGEGGNEMVRMLSNFYQDNRTDYVLVDSNYRIVSFTPGIGYDSTDYLPTTPELVMAKNTQIGSDIRPARSGEESLFVAVPILYEQETLGYLTLIRPMDPAYVDVQQQWVQLGSTTLPVLFLVIAVSLWLSGTISRPVQRLRNSALKMAEGAFDTRIETSIPDAKSQDEVDQLAQSFNYMAEQVEALMQAQRSFVSNAAHELRTPLMTLKLRFEALEDGTLTVDEQKRYFAEIQQEIAHMSELVSSLLVLARIDDSRIKENETVVIDTASAIRDIARQWRIAATKKHVEFEQEIPDTLPDLPMPVNHLRLVMDNLLGNAVKYTPAGKIYLTVSHQPDQLIIRVRDTGIGFDDVQAEQLFNRFYRTEDVRSAYEGTGLGLSIVEALLEQYGGKVTAYSEGKARGAVFELHIPFAAQTAPDAS
ncbi:MAG: HAMP domain-containing histidine kinase [Anaerolineaceae bacterium]|nr:HAMP domain-containing histidine kinase [Anaerolineaceae bacterium]